MANNPKKYGFRLHRLIAGGAPQFERGIVATSQSFDVNGGAQNVNLGAGDPLIKLSSGGFNLCDGIEGAGGVLAPSHICMGIDERGYWNAALGKMVVSDVLPSDVAWGTDLNRQSRIIALPVEAAIWEVDCDTAGDSPTEAGYQSEIGLNVNHILCGVVSVDDRAHPRLDISESATTNTFQWNIVDVSPTTDNRDFTGLYVKLLVRANVIQLKSAGVTGV